VDNASQSNTGVADHNDSVEDDLLMLKVTNHGNARSRSNSVTQKGIGGVPAVSLYKENNANAINSGVAAMHNEYNLDLKESSGYASRSITQKPDFLTSGANLKISASEIKQQNGTANHVKFEMRSNYSKMSKHSKPSSKPNRKSRKSDQKSAQEKEQDE